MEVSELSGFVGIPMVRTTCTALTCSSLSYKLTLDILPYDSYSSSEGSLLGWTKVSGHSLNPYTLHEREIQQVGQSDPQGHDGRQPNVTSILRIYTMKNITYPSFQLHYALCMIWGGVESSSVLRCIWFTTNNVYSLLFSNVKLGEQIYADLVRLLPQTEEIQSGWVSSFFYIN